ncbi:MAG TPA: DUF2637 domain-containing protein [Actinomycetes bacterium]|nr:DUF2637 domain-containing protein [Actinomycetes bacterium]
MTVSSASLAAVAVPERHATPERATPPAVRAAPQIHAPEAGEAGAVPVPSRWARLRRAIMSRRPQTASLLLQAIAGGALYLSYEGMHQLAVAAGYNKVQAAIWPLIVDGFVVHASRDVLRAWRAGQRLRTAFDSFLIVLAAGASAAFQATSAAGASTATANAAHAATAGAASAVAAAGSKPAAPLVLVVAAHVVPPVAALLALALEVFARYDYQQRTESVRRPKRSTPTRREASTTSVGATRQTATGGKARRTSAGGDPTGIGRLARQVEDAFVEREIRGGERLVAASLTVELEGDDRRKRRVQEILRQLRTAPTAEQQARINQARTAASSAPSAGPPVTNEEARP